MTSPCPPEAWQRLEITCEQCAKISADVRYEQMTVYSLHPGRYLPDYVICQSHIVRSCRAEGDLPPYCGDVQLVHYIAVLDCLTVVFGLVLKLSLFCAKCVFVCSCNMYICLVVRSLHNCMCTCKSSRDFRHSPNITDCREANITLLSIVRGRNSCE
jgi:hypothetical protein